ncbi:CU044_5270 family protein [Actinotalea sp. K2]|uniref:CU044_5270 family protein n=1 Tax=Actinotalea sp. K2 TaxID=2939438 RepID=UPI002016C85B|nr:CU044_5270 family protein [Actinotalea sp. K2]MCL3859564.1 CU044_5270 family protein [Actinotalea sp. K2]
MTDELLRDLADVADVPTRPVAQIQARARQLRVRRRRSRSAAAAVTLSGALVMASVIGFGPGPSGSSSATASQVLIAAGAAAGEQPGGWPEATYWYVASEIQYTGEDPYRRQSWIPRDPVLEGALQDPGVFGPDASLGADGVHTGSLGPTWFHAGGAIDWAGLYALPTDPVELERILRSDYNPDGASENEQLWESVKSLLVGTPAPPALRQALWEVTATIPGVELTGRVTDAAGRPGIAVERDDRANGRQMERLVVDPDEGRLLQIEQYTQDGVLAWRMTLLEQRPADTAPETDPPICGPGSEPHRSC